MGLQGILTLVVVGGLAAGAYYYRDGIREAFSQTQKSDGHRQWEEQKEREEYEESKNSIWNPNAWKIPSGWNNKKQPKSPPKQPTFDPNNDPSKFNPPNTKYNSDFPYGYSDTSGGRP